nr:hypothetical protein [Tanacetum cinerariifolium]
EKGSGLNWLFDIDSLTKSMNYVPVVDACTISTNFLGTKVDARQDVKKDVSSLRYIILPNWVHEEHFESTSGQPQDACNTDAPKSSGNSNLTATSTNPPADQLETLTVETPIPTDSSPVPTVCFTDSQEPSSETILISKRVTNQAETSSLDNILTLSNQFEDILRVTTNSKESSGVEADVSNMETTITASPTPTLKIHRDHPKSQIIDPMDTSIQTRNKFKENKKDEKGIVIINKARLVAQGHTQEEEIDYDEMDVKSAFLYGIINEEVYVMQPPRFQDPEYPSRVYKVEKAMGTIDQTLFIRRKRGDFILVQVYVDDIIFGLSNPQLCREFEALMHEKFQMSAMGELNFFLGLQVLQKKDGIFLSQDKYVGDILKNIGYSDVEHAMRDFVKGNLHIYTLFLEEREGVAATNSEDDAPIKGWSIDEGEAATERVSDDTEEMATVLTSMDAATVLASGVVDVPTGSGSIPTACSNLEQESVQKQKSSEEITEEAKSPEESSTCDDLLQTSSGKLLTDGK